MSWGVRSSGVQQEMLNSWIYKLPWEQLSSSREAKPREDPTVSPDSNYTWVKMSICGKEIWGLVPLPSPAHGWILQRPNLTNNRVLGVTLTANRASQVHGAAGKIQVTGIFRNLCWNKDLRLASCSFMPGTQERELGSICLPAAGQEPAEQRHSLGW